MCDTLVAEILVCISAVFIVSITIFLVISGALAIQSNYRGVFQMPQVSEYLKHIEKEFSAGNATEHTHRPALKHFIESFDSEVTATNEPKRQTFGAPDYMIRKRETPLGYIEAKDVDKNLDKLSKSDKEQLDRYLDSLSNLVLTNYLEFRW